MAPHSSTPAWKITWTAAVHGVTKSRTWLSDFTFTFHFHALEKEMATHSSFLAWRTPGTGGLPSLGSHRVGHDWSDLAAAATYLRSQKIYTQKTVRSRWKKSKMTQTDGLIDHVLELEESILWKWLYYPKQSTDSMESLSNYQRCFSQN